MAHTALRGPRHGVVTPVTLAIVVLLAAACGSPPPSVPPPTAAPTPLVTPNPHLGGPTTAEDVYNGLGRAGLKISANTASDGSGGAGIVSRIYATYIGWPLDVTEFETAAALTKAVKWTKNEAPGRGEPPVNLIGYNILVTWGPRAAGSKPPTPDDRQAAALQALVSALDRLLSPLKSRSVVPLAIAAAPASAAPGLSAAPKATPAP